MNNSSTIANFTSPTGNLEKYQQCLPAEFNGYHICMAVIALLIVLINMFVFFFINCSRQLRRNAGNLTLMGQSLNDTMTGLSILLLMIPNYYYTYHKCNIDILWTMYYISTAAYLTNKITLLCAVGHLLLLAGERMIGLFLPLHYKSLVVTKRVLPAIITVWVISITIPPLELTYQQSPNRILYTKIQAGFTIIGFGVIPTVLLCLQYIAMLTVIYKFKKKHAMEMKTVFVKHKALFIYLSMFLSFLFLILPYFVIRQSAIFTDQFIPNLLTRSFIAARFSPSLVNPFLYALFKDDFRKAFKRWQRRRRRTSESETKTLIFRFNESIRNKRFAGQNSKKSPTKSPDNVFV